MAAVLAATAAGCMHISDDGQVAVELGGHFVRSITSDGAGGCLAIVDGREIWRRSTSGEWSKFLQADTDLDVMVQAGGRIVAGASELFLLTVSPEEKPQRLAGFDHIEGRDTWFDQGPPLHLRSLAVTAGGGAILCAVHVGGIPRSTDGGNTWSPTVDINYDVHEVCAHPALSNVVAAAAAVGLCLSQDGGEHWDVIAEGPEDPHALAVVALEREVIFSVQDGPFADKSQIWRWHIGETGIEPVRDGLPLWQSGKVDTAHMGSGGGRAAFVDGGGNVWLSERNSTGWQNIAGGIPFCFGLIIV